jgi:hypothetical protein
LKDFFKTSARIAVAIFLTLVGLAIAFGVFSWVKTAYDEEQAKPFEEVRNWEYDLDSIHVISQARTKLIMSNLLVSVEIVGYPKYFSDTRNSNGYFIFEFLDKDDFRIISKEVKLSEFTTLVGDDSKETGLSYQFEEYLGLEEYKRFSRMQVKWNLITEAVAPKPVSEPEPQPVLDHCAPNISKAERLKRLAQYGAVRETGTDEYSAADHSVTFFHYDGSLMNCQ